jgi:hypothetical protein
VKKKSQKNFTVPFFYLDPEVVFSGTQMTSDLQKVLNEAI